MKVLDFSRMPISDVEGNVTELDYSKSIANLVYKSTDDVQEAELAMRIVREKKVSLTDEEIDLLRKRFAKEKLLAYIKMGFESMVRDAENV